jgi:subtilisin family serine protease
MTIPAGTWPARSATSSGTPAFDESTVLVGFQPGTSGDEQGTIENVNGAVEINVEGAETHVLRVAPGHVLDAVARLKTHPQVRYAEPNYRIQLDAVPNDPGYPQLWAMKNTGQTVNGIAGTQGADIRAEPAWSVTTGSASIVVGVVDSGIDYNHPDLAANVWSNPGGIGGCPAGTHGYNAIAKTCDPMDDHYHGTHVSGTIGAVGNNGIGVVGVNWTTSIMALKFSDASGGGLTVNAIGAIDFAVKAKQTGVNVRVLNNSWGTNGFSQALLDEINKAGANDILIVAAAGNSSTDNDFLPVFPSSFSSYGAANVISVAATDQSDRLAFFSSYGRFSVDLGAPGVNILSTSPNGLYRFLSGTSMATPHVTGAAALVLAKLGNAGMTVAQVKSAILGNVEAVPSLAGTTRTGGRLNVYSALTGLRPPPAHGYWLVARDGGIFPFGTAGGYGSTGGMALNQPVVGMARTPSGQGYWLVAGDGGIFPFGDAAGYGSTGDKRLNKPVVGMASTPTGRGYWLVASDGGIFPFGDAVGYGSTGNLILNQPVVGMASTSTGQGYWLVASDGGIFPFGDAIGYGSTGNVHLYRPIVGMAGTSDGHGYWLVASDGGIFPFGNAIGYGSTGNVRLYRPMVGMVPNWNGYGYWLVSSDGGIFPFGYALWYGSTAGMVLNQPIVGMAAAP